MLERKIIGIGDHSFALKYNPNDLWCVIGSLMGSKEIVEKAFLYFRAEETIAYKKKLHSQLEEIRGEFGNGFIKENQGGKFLISFRILGFKLTSSYKALEGAGYYIPRDSEMFLGRLLS